MAHGHVFIQKIKKTGIHQIGTQGPYLVFDDEENFTVWIPFDEAVELAKVVNCELQAREHVG